MRIYNHTNLYFCTHRLKIFTYVCFVLAFDRLECMGSQNTVRNNHNDKSYVRNNPCYRFPSEPEAFHATARFLKFEILSIRSVRHCLRITQELHLLVHYTLFRLKTYDCHCNKIENYTLNP